MPSPFSPQILYPMSATRRFHAPTPNHHPLTPNPEPNITPIQITNVPNPNHAPRQFAVFHTFSCDIKIHKAMRSTSLGLAMTSVSIDIPWQVPLLVHSQEASKLSKLEKLKTAQSEMLIAHEQEAAARRKGMGASVRQMAVVAEMATR